MTLNATALLIVFSGLPGTGKTTVGRLVARKLGAVYLRVDIIEQAVLRSMGCDVGATGYIVAQAVAEANLVLGASVIADCVNPVEDSRAGWRAVAAKASARILDVEIICSDRSEHRRRVEHRQADITGHIQPSWDTIERFDYQPWDTPRIVIDTAVLSCTEAADAVLRSAVV